VKVRFSLASEHPPFLILIKPHRREKLFPEANLKSLIWRD
jgi:hypothetical protein